MEQSEFGKWRHHPSEGGNDRLWRPTLTPMAIGLETAAVFALAWILFAIATLPYDSVFTIDGFYHFRMMELIWKEGPWVDIRWLPLTVLGEHGPDHHWLWHLLFSPFGAMDDRVLAFKLALITNGALVPAVFNLVCRLLGVPFAPLWSLLLLAGGVTFPARILMLRAQNIAICYLLLGTLFALRRSYLLLGLTVFLAIESYHGTVILALPILATILFLAIRERRIDGKLVLFPAAGLLAGLVINPWFPRNIGFLFFHLLFAGSGSLHLPIGNEWRSVTFFGLWQQAWPAHLLWLGGLIAVAVFRPVWIRQLPVLVINLMALLALLAYGSAIRFAEYYVPMAMLAAAVNTLPLIGMMNKRMVTASVVCLLLFSGWRVAVDLEQYRAVAVSRFSDYGEIVRTLEQRAKPDSLVFNGSGDDFPALFWQSAHFRYVNGLSSHFLAYQDPKRFLSWLAITGYQPPPPDTGKAILDNFGTRWVVVRRSDTSLYDRLRISPYATLELTTESGYLFSLHAPGIVPAIDR